jgi:hypothetical protein
MQTTASENESGRERYLVVGCLDRRGTASDAGYVIDRTRSLRPRRLGSGDGALVEARWLARILNGLERERASS